MVLLLECPLRRSPSGGEQLSRHSSCVGGSANMVRRWVSPPPVRGAVGFPTHRRRSVSRANRAGTNRPRFRGLCSGVGAPFARIVTLGELGELCVTESASVDTASYWRRCPLPTGIGQWATGRDVAASGTRRPHWVPARRIQWCNPAANRIGTVAMIAAARDFLMILVLVWFSWFWCVAS